MANKRKAGKRVKPLPLKPESFGEYASMMFAGGRNGQQAR